MLQLRLDDATLQGLTGTGQGQEAPSIILVQEYGTTSRKAPRQRKKRPGTEAATRRLMRRLRPAIMGKKPRAACPSSIRRISRRS